MKKTKHSLNTWAFLGIYLAILAVFAGVYTLTKAMNKPAPVVGTGHYTCIDRYDCLQIVRGDRLQFR